MLCTADGAWECYSGGRCVALAHQTDDSNATAAVTLDYAPLEKIHVVGKWAGTRSWGPKGGTPCRPPRRVGVPGPTQHKTIKLAQHIGIQKSAGADASLVAGSAQLQLGSCPGSAATRPCGALQNPRGRGCGSAECRRATTICHCACNRCNQLESRAQHSAAERGAGCSGPATAAASTASLSTCDSRASASPLTPTRSAVRYQLPYEPTTPDPQLEGMGPLREPGACPVANPHPPGPQSAAASRLACPAHHHVDDVTETHRADGHHRSYHRHDTHTSPCSVPQPCSGPAGCTSGMAPLRKQRPGPGQQLRPELPKDGQREERACWTAGAREEVSTRGAARTRSPGGGTSRSGGGGLGRLRPSSLLLSVLLTAALQGALLTVPCAAAGWTWLWDRASKAAAATPAAGDGGQYGGLMPYGWRKYGGTAQKGGPQAADDDPHVASDAPPGIVTFSGGVIAVDVNPSGDVEALLAGADDGAAGEGAAKPKRAKRDRSSRKSDKDEDEDEGGDKDVEGEEDEVSDAQQAFRELLLSKRLPFDPTKPYKLPPVSYRSSDFVFATGSFPSRYLLAQSTRSWRRGIRAFIAVNNTEDLPVLNSLNEKHGERYGYFPDETRGDLGPQFHGHMRGDTRAAMAPFLAHEHFGETYKWLLYGDDDTLFYMPAVKRLLAHLDPELPLAISDNLWYRSRHPNLFSPRCLPCHLAVDADPPPPAEEGEGAAAVPHRPMRIPNITAVMDGYLRFVLGTRSTANLDDPDVKELLSKRTFTDFNRSQALIAHLGANASVPGMRYVPRPACPFCTAQAACTPSLPKDRSIAGLACSASGGHGGAGMIFSVGLLRRLSSERMKACFMRIIRAPGGDALLSACLWEAGYGFTDPGASTLALYDGNYVLFSSEAAKWALHDPLTVMLRGKCDVRCKWLVRNAASHHGRGRHFQNFQQSAAYLYGNMASYTATHKWLAFMAGRDGDLAELEALVRGDRGGGATVDRTKGDS